jgi:hypothetical protein
MKRQIFWKAIGSSLLFCLIYAPTAWSAGTYVGLEAGAAILNAGAGSRFDWGLNAGTRILPNVLVGAYYTYIPFGSVSSPSGVSVSGSEKFYGAEGRWDFTPLLTGFTAGVRMGLSGVSTEAVVPGRSEDDESSNGFAWGPIFTYERPISTSFTFGGQMSLMLPSETAANNVFALVATLRYWF